MAKQTPSAQQEVIFDHFRKGPESGNGVVTARAGTGKTWSIEKGIAFAPEQKIGYVVFNKKNQLEAKDKITDPRVKVNTGHSLGFSFVKFVGGWKNATPKYSNQVERDRVEASSPAGFKGKLPKPVVKAATDLVSWAKSTAPFATQAELAGICARKGFNAGEIHARQWPTAAIAALAFGSMERAKVQDTQHRISFDDMVWLPVVMGWCRAWYELLVIDEAQDTNPTALMLAQKSVKPSGRMLVVGDDRQAIYGFRGADSNALARLQRELNAKNFPLTITYRCPKAVVAQAATLVPDYEAAPEAPEGIVNSVGPEALLRDAKPGDAILSRKNAPLMGYCLQLLRRGTTARIEGRDIGYQLLNLVRSLHARNLLDFIDRINGWQRRKLENLHNVGCDDKATLDSIRDQAEVLLVLADDVEDLREVETKLQSLFQDSDKNPRPAVVLSSVHKAKGLEWNHTYLLTDTFTGQTSDEVNEEANIKYVAITRAKVELTWVTSDSGENEELVANAEGL